jgi:signal transduction histidine kinase
MPPDDAPTMFAPAGRADAPTIARQSQALQDDPMLKRLYDATIEVVVVLNSQRQIVFANRSLLGQAGLADGAALCGLRPGEALQCTHAGKGPGGCGTSEFCAACGAVLAILESQQGRPAARECRIVRRDGEAVDLLVRAVPLAFGQETYTIFAATDISYQKRLRALERIFFHDLLNAVTGLQLLSQCLHRGSAEQKVAIQDNIARSIDLLAEEIAAQRDLMAAESLELPVHPMPLRSRQLVEEVIERCRPYEEMSSCHVRLAEEASDFSFYSDRAIVSRVLGNLLKNAVEASQAGEVVSLGCGPSDGGVEFHVHNPGVIPAETRAQLFQRSFSTKGSGRGLGTYSVKLLTERYLQGRASVASTEQAGTTFRVWYPRTINGSFAAAALKRGGA